MMSAESGEMGHEKPTELNYENPIQSPVPQDPQYLKGRSVKVSDIYKTNHHPPAYIRGNTAERGVRLAPYVSAAARYDDTYILSVEG
jgi:hypothetical protein